MEAAEETIKALSRYVLRLLSPGASEGLITPSPAALLTCSTLLIIYSVLVKPITTLAFLALIGPILSKAIGIELREFLYHEYTFIPLFTALIALPSIFGFVTPGKALTGFSFFGLYITITLEGVKAAVTLWLRVLSATSYLVVVTLKYGVSDLMDALSALKIPSLLVDIINLMIRYSSTLARSMIAMIDGRRARKVGRERMMYSWKRWGEAIGALYLHAARLSEETYLAMKARGYGYSPVAEQRKFSLRVGDIVLALITIMLMVAGVIIGSVMP